ncbi:MAG: Tim44-like domain-containing protein [Pseudomonadota bacterium]|nr:Tim44-like domain-containing protein [Pseudomonadota bacterium]
MAVLTAVTLLADDADARRLGGGRSIGSQRQSVAPSAAAPGAAANPVMPGGSSALAPRAAPAAPAAAAVPPRSGMSRWLGPIAGIAAGLGIAALLSHFGLSEGFGNLLLIALLVIGVFLIVRLVFRRKTGPLQYATATPTPGNTWSSQSAPARSERVEPVFGSSAPPAETPRVPAGFDREGFLRQARTQFKTLQAAWDTGDRRVLADVTTPEMFEEINRDLATRGAHQPTDVVRVDADLLEVATENTQHWASVRFSGLLREDGIDTPKPFDETWNLVKPVDGSSGWLLAGIQQNEPAVVH